MRYLLAVSMFAALGGVAQAATIYVDGGASGGDNGTSWFNAYADLQNALAVAGSGDEIWVAGGTYKPTGGTDTTISFTLVDGIAVYGGFAGAETARDQRDWVVNVSILSGDIGLAGDNTDNSNNVVIGASGATLDGITVTDGYAFSPRESGGGIYNDAVTNLTVTNCIFSNNLAFGEGGGIANWNYSSLTVTNCTFAGNLAFGEGGGIANWDYSSLTVTNCTFAGNSAYEGGGMWSSFSTLTVMNCTFSSNSANYGGGGMMNSWSVTSPTVTNCTFVGNVADAGGGMFNFDLLPIVTNCIFSGNSATFSGGGMLNYESADIANCTFSGNSAGIAGGGMSSTSSSPTVTNCVLWGNTAPAGPQIDDSIPVIDISYSVVEGGWPGAGNVDADPLFVDADGADNIAGTLDDDLHLLEGSPCIDAANGDVAPATDIEGGSRHDDSGMGDAGVGTPVYVDMGVHEFQGTTTVEAVTLWGPPAGILVPVGRSAEIEWFATGSFLNVRIELSRDGGVTWEDIVASTPNDRSYLWIATDGGQSLPQEDCVIRISDALDGAPSGTISFVIFDGICRVDSDAPGPVHDGLSWATAFLNPQGALAAVASGSEIRVAEGTYYPTAGADRTVSFILAEGVAVEAGFAGFGEPDPNERDIVAHETILSGDIGVASDNTDNSYHVVVGASDAALDGFTVIDGNADGASGLRTVGGGMNNYDVSDLVITNCIFSGNSATGVGGGMANLDSSSLTVDNCIFINNSADQGGGMYNSGGSSTVTNCTFSGNTGGGGIGGAGGAIANYESSSTVTSCTFSGNSAYEGGGVLISYGALSAKNCIFVGNSAHAGGGMGGFAVIDVTDCIFAGNSADLGGAMYSFASSPVVTNSIFSGNSATSDGGAVYDRACFTTYTNCTFSGNSAGSRGGVVYIQGFGELTTFANSALWGNTAATEPVAFIEAGAVSVSHSVVQGGWPGTGNLDADPLFVDADGADNTVGTLDDNLRLLAGSPCIDAADGDAAPATDIVGVSRSDDDLGTPNTGTGTPPCADIGAHEFQTGILWPSSLTPSGGGCAPGGGSPLALALVAIAMLVAMRRRRHA